MSDWQEKIQANMNRWSIERMEELEQKLDLAINALEFYSQKSHYENTDSSCGNPECCSDANPSYVVVDDGGEKARKVLEQIKG